MSQQLHNLMAAARRNKKALFLPYFCVGYPSFNASLEASEAALKAGAAALELGAPYSDPIADGPTLQKATQLSLERGTRFMDVFRLIRRLRAKGYNQPLLVMTYLNMVEQMTWKKFAETLRTAGGDGAIVPDLPLEEFRGPRMVLRRKGLSLIPFIAPTSSPERVKKADAQGAPFLYYVSVTGVTGARKSLAPGLLKTLGNLRGKLKTPIVVGFGISNPDQAGQVGKAADGVIIASALIQMISKLKVSQVGQKVERFCRKVVQGLGKNI
jgi:tryptophan synthase alpha chain